MRAAITSSGGVFFINVERTIFQWNDKQETRRRNAITASQLCLPSSAGREGIRERLQQRRLCPLSFKTRKLLVRANCLLARGADFSWRKRLTRDSWPEFASVFVAGSTETLVSSILYRSSVRSLSERSDTRLCAGGDTRAAFWRSVAMANMAEGWSNLELFCPIARQRKIEGLPLLPSIYIPEAISLRWIRYGD